MTDQTARGQHHIAHVLDEDGVSETLFTRTGPTTYTNTEEITLRPGATLDLGGGMSITNPAEPPELRITWEGPLEI